jgi:hypothetical protein
MENGRVWQNGTHHGWGVKLIQELKICEWLKVEGMNVEEKCTLRIYLLVIRIYSTNTIAFI